MMVIGPSKMVSKSLFFQCYMDPDKIRLVKWESISWEKGLKKWKRSVCDDHVRLGKEPWGERGWVEGKRRVII